MSARPGVLVTVREAADGGVSPNAYVPMVSVEVRAFWPPKSEPEAVEEAIQRAADQAIDEHRRKRAEW